MKTALVADWLITHAGAERVLSELVGLYPQADLFSVVDFLPHRYRRYFGDKKTTTTFIQKLPFAKKLYRHYLPLMPVAIESLDLKGYDLVLSVSHAVAKGVLTHEGQTHICYLQARNMKYLYEDRSFYPKKRFTGLIQDALMTPLRIWDYAASQRPDVTVANSRFVARWHEKRHGVSCDVIYPPVDFDFFAGQFRSDKEDYYATVGRLEPYKRMDLIVDAFNRIGKKLVVIGSGTEMKRLKSMASPNIEFLGYQDSAAIAKTISGAKAFVFAAREDFGIAPLEAQACGTPVIAFSGGGSLETIRGLDQEKPSGVLFEKQDAECLAEAIHSFESGSTPLRPEDCRENALRFSSKRFRDEFTRYVDSKTGKKTDL